MEAPVKEETHQVLKVLEALKQASHDLQSNPTPKTHDSIKALLELETEADTILSTDPNLSSLAGHLTRLKALVHTLHGSRGRNLGAFLSRRVSAHEISRLAGSIETEIQSWIDRESIEKLLKTLNGSTREENELKALVEFENRVSQGFNRELQDLVLRSRVFASLEKVLCDMNCTKKLRDHSAFVIASLIRFNKDVFVGEVRMGPTVRALIRMASVSSLGVLCSLIKSIKSPLVDEIVSNGEIPSIIGLLGSSHDLDLRIAATDCVLEIGYYGRKEAIEAMLREGLIKKLVEMQRSELGGDSIDVGRAEERGNWGVGAGGVREKRGSKERAFLESHPFASCVARFAVQLEVGEGLRQRERRAFKQEILIRVREASLSDAEAATIVAEVLWGSSP